MISRAGTRGRPPAAPADPARHIILHGSNFHGHIFPGDVDQMVGTWLSKIFYQRLVLVGFHHCHGKRCRLGSRKLK